MERVVHDTNDTYKRGEINEIWGQLQDHTAWNICVPEMISLTGIHRLIQPACLGTGAHGHGRALGTSAHGHGRALVVVVHWAVGTHGQWARMGTSAHGHGRALVVVLHWQWTRASLVCSLDF